MPAPPTADVLRELGDEVVRRQLADLLPGRLADVLIRRDQPDGLALAVLGRKALEQAVGVRGEADLKHPVRRVVEIGRASCRERVKISVVAGSLKKKSY